MISPLTEEQFALDKLSLRLNEHKISHRFCNDTLPSCTIMHNLDHKIPQLIIWPKSTEDVQISLASINDLDELKTTPKSVVSGGHGYDGEAMCEGITIDMQHMNSCTMESDRLMAEAGCSMRKVIHTLKNHRLVIPHGDSLTVGVGGHYISAGWDLILSRKLGLGCKHVVAATIVYWDGTCEVLHEANNPQLFHAVKGSFADNKGIITSLALNTNPEPVHANLAEATLDHKTLPSDIISKVYHLPNDISTTFRFYFEEGTPKIVLVLGSLLDKDLTVEILKNEISSEFAHLVNNNWVCHNLEDVRYLPLLHTAREDWESIVAMTTEEFEEVSEKYWKPIVFMREMMVSYCQQRSCWLDIHTGSDVFDHIMQMLKSIPHKYEKRIYGNITIGGGAIWETKHEVSTPVGKVIIRFESHSDDILSHQTKSKEIADAFTAMSSRYLDEALVGKVYSGDKFS